MGAFHNAAPLVSSFTCAFVVGSIAQEFARGAAVRMRKGEGALRAVFKLVARARRRYGGYIVHVGFAISIIDEQEARFVFDYLDRTGEERRQ